MGRIVDRSMLPWTASELEGQMADILSPDDVEPDLIRHARDPAAAPRKMLPALAADRSVDRWFPDWPEGVKRERIAESLDLHAEKGTLAAVERVLTDIGAEYSILEGEAYSGPFTMLVSVLNSDLLFGSGQVTEDALRQYLEDAKRLSVHMQLVCSTVFGGGEVAIAGGADAHTFGAIEGHIVG